MGDPPPDLASPAVAQQNPIVLEPQASRVAELSKLRRSELESISARLGRMSKREWHRVWAASSLLIMGGVIGGLVGYLGIDEPTDAQTKRYVIVLGLAAFLAGVCFLARLTTKAQRDDSVQAIKEDLDTLLAAYPMPEESP